MRRRPSSAVPQGPDEHTTYPIVGNAQLQEQATPLMNGAGGGGPSPPLQPPPPPPPAAAAHPPSQVVVTGPADSILQPLHPPNPRPLVINPPIPPQHVYAPMPALGALSIGFLSKKNKKKEEDDFKLITNGKKRNPGKKSAGNGNWGEKGERN